MPADLADELPYHMFISKSKEHTPKIRGWGVAFVETLNPKRAEVGWNRGWEIRATRSAPGCDDPTGIVRREEHPSATTKQECDAVYRQHLLRNPKP